ncbi:nuclear transport factor 2 family protein [Actinoplanes sp. TFC3]|uniref:nuclear transport factor 2 family protein n=1 Tax=Actinoplanes sp. TFC3 TaxID=1710355 RepID=UPI0008346776|nr:nuclear transport factor 2 family protein [Actinoplanes sp. TFC3]
MTLPDPDRDAITDLINLHGHLTDAADPQGADRLFTPDVIYDLEDFGRGTIHGIAALHTAGRPAGPLAHHVTNIVIVPTGDGEARVQSKGLAINRDGTAGSVTYDDVVTRRPEGWRISHRKVSAARTARIAGPREVLERFRRASIEQSVDGMGALYATGAVLEFPFTPAGVPSRLVGRDAIMTWIAKGWRANQLTYERYRERAVHDTADPGTIVVE